MKELQLIQQQLNELNHKVNKMFMDNIADCLIGYDAYDDVPKILEHLPIENKIKRLDIHFNVIDDSNKLNQKYKSLITEPEELVVGNTYFVVRKLNSESWVTDIQVNSKPKKAKHKDSLYINIESYNSYAGEFLADNLFLNDFNIPENSYNKHRIFSNEKEAIDYVNS